VSNREDAVGVNLKGDIDLGGATGGRWDASDVELPELVAVAHHRSLPLVHRDVDHILFVNCASEAGGLGCRLRVDVHHILFVNCASGKGLRVKGSWFMV